MLVMIYRFFIGGAGVAAGFSEILFAILIGMFFHRFCKNKQNIIKNLIAMGVFVTLGSMVSVLALPIHLIVPALKLYSIPILIFYPAGTVLIGLLFTLEERQIMTQKKLQESEEFLRTAYKAAENVAFIYTDLAGEDTKILDFSPGAEKIFGYRKQEVLNKPIAMLHPLEMLELFSSIQNSLVEGKKST